jgi:hypothetical protein
MSMNPCLIRVLSVTRQSQSCGDVRTVFSLFDLPNKPLLQPFPQWLVVKPQIAIR